MNFEKEILWFLEESSPENPKELWELIYGIDAYQRVLVTYDELITNLKQMIFDGIDQQKALEFYTSILGFIKKTDIPVGDARWLTIVSPEDQKGTELLLEPNAEYPPMKQLKEALFKDKIPYTAFEVSDIKLEYNRLLDLGVNFIQKPTKNIGVLEAVFDDTFGNLIQIFEIVTE